MSVRERDCREWGRGVWPEQVGGHEGSKLDKC